MPLGFFGRGRTFFGNLRWLTLPSFLGMLCNLLAIALNGWQMPVIGADYIPAGEVWKVADNPNVPWLVDRFNCSWGIYSVGDVLLCAGALIIPTFLLYKLIRKIF